MGGWDVDDVHITGRGVKYLLCAVELESGGCHGDGRVRKGARGRTLRAFPQVRTQTEGSHARQRWPAVTEGEQARARTCVHVGGGVPVS